MTPAGNSQNPWPVCRLLGMDVAMIDARQVLDHMFARLAAGSGGWLVTANLDFLRRYCHDPDSRALYDQADLRVADGMPLVWAARLQGDRLPERVAGSSLIWQLVERAAAEGRSIYMLGGEPGSNDRAAQEFQGRWPDLKVCGRSSPRFANPPTEAECAALGGELESLRPDILLVGLGSPKQELVIRALRARLPATWMIGVGISFSFVAGDVRRAPTWMRRAGLEWAHRLVQEPRRLARRYLVDDLPFAVRLFAAAAARRIGVGGDAP